MKWILSNCFNYSSCTFDIYKIIPSQWGSKFYLLFNLENGYIRDENNALAKFFPLSNVSRYSDSSFESATIPPPT